LPQQDDSVVEEVELSIPLLTDAGQLVKFVGQVEDALHATVVQTVGSWEWGTDITIAVQPTPLENILGRLKSMIDVETVEDGPDARCDPGILKRFKGLLGGRELPPKRLLVTLKQAGMPDMSCQGLAMALN